MEGKQVMTADGNGQYSTQIDVAKLITGTYFITLKGIGQSKFIVK